MLLLENDTDIKDPRGIFLEHYFGNSSRPFIMGLTTNPEIYSI